MFATSCNRPEAEFIKLEFCTGIMFALEICLHWNYVCTGNMIALEICLHWNHPEQNSVFGYP